MAVGLSVTILGCDGSYPARDGACSGYLVEGGGTRVWIDTGTGTMAHLQRHVGLIDVDAVVLSHEHPDHWSDLEGFHVACRYMLHRTGIPLYAPQSLRDRTYQADMSPVLVWHEVTGGDTVEVGGLSFTFSRTDHPPETLAMRIEGEGRAFGYSADTGPGWPLAALGTDLDLALCEATLPQDEEGSVPGHLSARQAGESAREAGVGRLVLTHLWPTNDREQSQREGADAFGAPVEMARLHHRFEV